MRKKIAMSFMFIFIAVSVTSCGKANVKIESNQANNVKSSSSIKQEEITEQEKNTEASSLEQVTANSLDELNDRVLQDLDDRITILNERYEKLKADIDTYEKYIDNTESIDTFYNDTYEETKEICIKMREYCLDYARLIIEAKGNKNDKYDDFEELYDTVYDDGGEKIYDEVYDGILDDIYDVFYDGILDEAYDTVEYEEWLDAQSDEYERWSDTRSDVYEEWSDARSDIFEFWSDIRSEIWEADYEKAEEEIQDFQEDIAKLQEE